MDETYIEIKGKWQYLYRAVDKEGQTIDFLLSAYCDRPAVLRFFKRAVPQHGLPEKVTMQSIERVHMIKKGQMLTANGKDLSAAEQFYSLAA